jgi:hypothetical protein
MKRNLIKTVFFTLVVLAAVLAIGSCSISITGASYIRIANISGSYTLSNVNITGHNNLSWGPELLAPAHIAPGNSGDFQANAGLYDIWVTDTLGVDAKLYGVQVTSGDTTTVYYDGFTLAL